MNKLKQEDKILLQLTAVSLDKEEQEEVEVKNLNSMNLYLGILHLFLIWVEKLNVKSKDKIFMFNWR